MSGNKQIRELMEKKYGKKCMMEAARIRYVPMEKRKKIAGYKRTDEVITYHHLVPKSEKGETTEENGALLKNYNHKWLEKQTKYVREGINNELRKYKLRIAGLEITGDGRIGNQMVMDLDDVGEFLEIPLYPNKTKEEEEKDIGVNPDDIIRARNEEAWYK